jgi:density-regulated protein DRP1
MYLIRYIRHTPPTHHLRLSGIDLKKASKQFATKFATGASVSKNLQGADEIVVQGDVTDEIVEMLEGNVGILKGVPADNVICVEDKKKKGGTSEQ